MTISSTTRKAGPFVGNGVATSFPFTFKVFATSDIVVTLTVIATGVESTLALTTDYTVSLNADQNANPGGSVTYNPLSVPMTSAREITITSAVPQLQTLNIQNAGGFFPTVLNAAFDRVVILVQQLALIVSRGLAVGVADTPPGPLPNLAARASKFLAFNGSGNPIAAEGVASVPVSAVFTPVLAAATLAAARLVLGVAALSSFHVNRNGVNQTAVASATATKIQFNNKVFDINNEFDSVTNFRHTPVVAGKYRYDLNVKTATGAGANLFLQAVIGKNGVVAARRSEVSFIGAAQGVGVSVTLSMNGTTDYVEFYYVNNNAGTSDIDGAAVDTFACGEAVAV